MVIKNITIIILIIFLTSSSHKKPCRRDNTVVLFKNETEKIIISPFSFDRKMITEKKFTLDDSLLFNIRNMQQIEGALFDDLVSLEVIKKQILPDYKFYYYGSINYNEKFNADLVLVSNNYDLVSIKQFFLINSVNNIVKSTTRIAVYMQNANTVKNGYSYIYKNKEIRYKFSTETIDVLFSNKAKRELKREGKWKEIIGSTLYSNFYFDDSGFLRFK